MKWFDYPHISIILTEVSLCPWSIYPLLSSHQRRFMKKRGLLKFCKIRRKTPVPVSAFKWLLETLLLAIKMCTGFTTDIIEVNTIVCSVTSEPTQRSSRRVSSFKDSLVLLTTEWNNMCIQNQPSQKSEIEFFTEIH